MRLQGASPIAHVYILIGSTLGPTIHLCFFDIPLFMRAWLTFAGITGLVRAGLYFRALALE